MDALREVVLSAANARDNQTNHQKANSVIRLPQDGDWGALRDLVRKVGERTVFSDMPFSKRKYTALEAEVRNPRPHQCLLLAEVYDRVVGRTWFSADEYLLGESSVLTTTYLIGVDADYCGPFRFAKVAVKLLHDVAVGRRYATPANS